VNASVSRQDASSVHGRTVASEVFVTFRRGKSGLHGQTAR